MCIVVISEKLSSKVAYKESQVRCVISINIAVYLYDSRIFGIFYCRLTNLLKEHKPHFVRVAGYMVADLLQYFETYTLYPEVKVSGCTFGRFSDSEMLLGESKSSYVLDCRHGITM
jgi:hypothetical protein